MLGPHPLLAQVPLTVSPFISLPSAPTLPYTYKPLPSTLPPSSTASENGTERARYVVAPSGHAAHPDEIIASCRAIEAHIQKTQDNAVKAIEDWKARLKEEELAEKRRVAPGWLDREEKILEPEKQASKAKDNDRTVEVGGNLMDQQDDVTQEPMKYRTVQDTAGEALDRAFGGMGI